MQSGNKYKENWGSESDCLWKKKNPKWSPRERERASASASKANDDDEVEMSLGDVPFEESESSGVCYND